MALALDQSRLRRIVHTLLPTTSLASKEALIMMQMLQVAAGVDDHTHPMEYAHLQAIAQHIGGLAGLEPGDLVPIPPVAARADWFGRLAENLTTPGARDLAYVLLFTVSVADLVLTPAERQALEELQHALGIDDRRATDLVVLLTQVLASDSAA